MEVMGWLSGFASSLPGMFINLLLMVITTFFIAADYELLTGFCLRQLGERPKEVFMEIQSYVVGTFCVYPLLCPDYDHYLCGTVHWTASIGVENSRGYCVSYRCI